jgi:hypothetical protein
VARTGCRVAAVLVFAAAPLGAQVTRDSEPAPRIEGRVDALIQTRTAAEAGVGVFVPVGIYVRTGLIAGAGVIGRPAGAAGRIEAVGRYLLDPLAEHRWGPYLAGGVGVRADARARGRPYLLAMLGLEGPRWGAVVPAIEAGLGSGVRVGFALRRAQVTGWR